MSDNKNSKELGNCEVCSVESTSICSNCQQVFYCSVLHQKEDWKKHKLNCHPFIIKKNQILGRHLIASRNITVGEIVLKESPLVWGPSQFTEPVCVGCMKGLDEFNYMKCEYCGWPICERECQNIAEHQNECQFTVRYRDKVQIGNFTRPHPIYQSLTPLRCLLLSEKNPEIFEKLMKLEYLNEERKQSLQWESDLQGVAKFIPKYFKCNKWSEDDIMKITGIIQINGHEVPLSEPPYIAIYDKASFIQHSCNANLTKTFTKNGDIILWAPKSIPKGTNLSICYTDAFWSEPNRRYHLLQTKMFRCNCDRCLDVTEFGTNYNAIYCNDRNCKGLALPETIKDWDSHWKCKKCKKIIDKEYIKIITERAGKDLSTLPAGNIEAGKSYLKQYSKWFPESNHSLASVKVILAQIIGSGGPEIFQAISDEELNLKLDLCKEMIELYEILSPAETRTLGALHFEFHAALTEKGRRVSKESQDNGRSYFEECMKEAELAIFCLQYEPLILAEGQLCRQAKINYNTLKILLG